MANILKHHHQSNYYHNQAIPGASNSKLIFGHFQTQVTVLAIYSKHWPRRAPKEESLAPLAFLLAPRRSAHCGRRQSSGQRITKAGGLGGNQVRNFNFCDSWHASTKSKSKCRFELLAPEEVAHIPPVQAHCQGLPFSGAQEVAGEKMNVQSGNINNMNYQAHHSPTCPKTAQPEGELELLGRTATGAAGL